MSLKPPQIARIRELIQEFSVADVRKLTGHSELTIAKYKYRGHGPCRCGKVVGHNGRCPARHFQLKYKLAMDRLARKRAEERRNGKRVQYQEVLAELAKVPVEILPEDTVPFPLHAGELGPLRKLVVDAFIAGDKTAYEQGITAMAIWLRKKGIRTTLENAESKGKALSAINERKRQAKALDNHQ